MGCLGGLGPVRMFFSFPKAFPKNGNYFMLSEGEKKGKKRRKEEKEEKKGRERREKGRKGEKKGRRRKGKEGKREYADSVGGCVGRFFFQSPEVCQKLGRHPEFLATGDFTTVVSRRRGSRRLHRTSV